jgi:hypothetical protein
MSLMYTELSDMGADLPPMAPFAVRESSLAIGRSSGPEHRGGYTQPEERIGIKRIAPNETDHDSGSSSGSSGSIGSIGSDSGFDGAIGSTGANGPSGSSVPKGPQVSSCSLGRLGPLGHSVQSGPSGQWGPSGPSGQWGQWGQWGRGAIAPVSPMVSLGANMPLAVFVVLVLNALMMLLCAVALLSRGGRSA